MREPNPFNLRHPLNVESFVIESFSPTVHAEEATTYLTAAPGITCYFPTNCAPVQKCDAYTDVCF